MPLIGGRLGWNEPPPAAITTTFASNVLPPSVPTRNSGSPIFSSVVTISPRWKVGLERLDLLHQGFGQAVAGDVGDAGNVVDRLFRIKLGALAADLVEDVDQVRLDIEQAELEHREQADRPRADDQNVGLDRLAHSCPLRRRPAPRFEFPMVTPTGARCDRREPRSERNSSARFCSGVLPVVTSTASALA